MLLLGSVVCMKIHIFHSCCVEMQSYNSRSFTEFQKNSILVLDGAAARTAAAVVAYANEARKPILSTKTRIHPGTRLFAVLHTIFENQAKRLIFEAMRAKRAAFTFKVQFDRFQREIKIHLQMKVRIKIQQRHFSVICQHCGSCYISDENMVESVSAIRKVQNKTYSIALPATYSIYSSTRNPQ